MDAPERWESIWLSFTVAACATATTLPIGIALGYLLARRRIPGQVLLEILVYLPLVLPPVVTGYLLLLLFGRRGWIGSPLERWFGLEIAFTWWAAVLAAAVVSLPLVVRSARIGFQGVDPRLELAARTLGAGPWRTFFVISIPLAWRGLLAGASLAFARSLGEFGATIVFAGNIPGETQTLSLAVYAMTQRPDGFEASWPLVLLSVAMAAAALALCEGLERGEERRADA